MSLADNIKELITSHKLSQTEFGRIAGVSDKAVSTWENGEMKNDIKQYKKFRNGNCRRKQF